MSTKIKALILLALLVAAYTSGRYATPARVVTVTQIVEKKVVDTNVSTDVHKVTVIEKKPDGSTTTTITDNSIRDTSSTSTTTKNTNSSVDVRSVVSTTNVSLLAGLQPRLAGGVSLGPIVYGASVTKSDIMPIFHDATVGIWGLSNLTFGASVGWNFP